MDRPTGSERRDFSNLNALFVNCTLKRSPRTSHTAGLMEKSVQIMKDHGVTIDELRAVDHNIRPGVQPDMSEQGWESDDWPDIFKRVMDADILVLGSPIWLGEKSSVCTLIIERLYAMSAKTNDLGQYLYYGKVGGCIITGNEDGVKHCSANILYALQHLGYSIAPQSDAGWIGEAGPGPSYLDDESGGPDNEFTKRTTTFMTWNMMHLAAILKDRGGFPAYGNVRTDWDDGERFGYPE